MAEHVTNGSGQTQFLCTKSIARRFGLSPSWFEKARCRGEGPPFYRISTKILYAVDEADNWMAQHRVSGRPGQ